MKNERPGASGWMGVESAAEKKRSLSDFALFEITAVGRPVWAGLHPLGCFYGRFVTFSIHPDILLCGTGKESLI